MLALLTITWLIPPQVIMIPNFVLVNRMGLLDTLAALVILLGAAIAALGLDPAVEVIQHGVDRLPECGTNDEVLHAHALGVPGLTRVFAGAASRRAVRQ